MRYLDIVITRSVLFSLKCTRNRLAAGLRPDPLGSLNAPQTAVLGGWMGPPEGWERKGEERRGRIGREGEEGMGEEGGEKEGREGKGNGALAQLNPKLKLRPFIQVIGLDRWANDACQYFSLRATISVDLYSLSYSCISISLLRSPFTVSIYRFFDHSLFRLLIVAKCVGMFFYHLPVVCSNAKMWVLGVWGLVKVAFLS